MAVELPEARVRISESEDSLGIGLNSAPAPKDVVADTIYFMEVKIERLSSREFEDARNARIRYGPSSGDARRFRLWTDALHERLSQLDATNKTFYRLDLRCEDGDMLRASAEVRQIVDEKHQRLYASEDDATVRRILQSLRCLPTRS